MKRLTPATMIVKGLWIGNERDSQCENFIRANKINVIVNCSKEIPNKFSSIEYYRVPVNDPGNVEQMNISAPNNNIFYNHLPFVTSFIFERIMRGENVLVHCHAGIQRSAAIVAAFLMRYMYARKNGEKKQITFIDAMNIITSKRPIAFRKGTFSSFSAAMLKFEDDLNY